MYYSDRIERDAIAESLHFRYGRSVRRVGISGIRLTLPRHDDYKGVFFVVGHRCSYGPSAKQRFAMKREASRGWWCRWVKSGQACWEAIEAYEEGAKP